MDVYRDIKKNIKEYFIEKENDDIAKYVGKIIDSYIKHLLNSLFHNGEVYIHTIGAKLYITIKPIAYITNSMYKNMLISGLNSNYLFEIKMRCDKWKRYRFTFKSMKKLKYALQHRFLNTKKVYKLIDNYEKSIL